MFKSEILPFAALSAAKLYEIMQLRNAVFVVEQNCVYQDADGIDPDCLHVMVRDDASLAGYCRLVPPGLKYPEWSIGRVITAPSARGKGVGHSLMQAAIPAIEQQGGAAIRISAQKYLEKFYSGYGFKPVGQDYLEDNIPHIEMLRPQSNRT